MTPSNDGSTIREEIADTPDEHGFLAVGLNTLCLDHFPMFGMKNHRYQSLLHVSMPGPALEQYRDAVRKAGGVPFVIGNISDDLMTLPEIKAGRRTRFLADVFQGLPQDPNKAIPLIHSVVVKIEQLLYYRPFDDVEPYPPELTYLLFGSGSEAFLSHYLTRAPDFQHIVSLTRVPAWLPGPLLEAGCRVSIPAQSGGKPFSSPPLADGQELQVRFQNYPNLLPLAVNRTIYFQTGL